MSDATPAASSTPAPVPAPTSEAAAPQLTREQQFAKAFKDALVEDGVVQPEAVKPAESAPPVAEKAPVPAANPEKPEPPALLKLGLDRDFLDAPDEWSDSGDQPLHLERELRAEAEMLVDEARRILQPYQVSIDTVIEEGNAATELLGQVENGDYDLIVLGATGLTDLRHGLVGSVSSKVAWTALCSVLIVKTSA